MKLSQLAAKPQLIKITLDDKEIMEEHGESIEFWTWDRQPLDIFMKLAGGASAKDPQSMIGIVRTLILDENGKEVITGENMLPSNILLKVITKVVELLGK